MHKLTTKGNNLNLKNENKHCRIYHIYIVSTQTTFKKPRQVVLNIKVIKTCKYQNDKLKLTIEYQT